MNIAETIHRQTEDVYTEIVRHYQYLHRHPELSYHEENTSRYVADFLEAEGISFRRNIGGNGLLAWVQGTKPDNGHTVAFVADMDALPVQEKNEIPYKSVHKGVMHACGHDSHTASLMGAAKMVHTLRDELAGRALFVFQPGEEQSPGGADLMLKDHLFADREPDFIVKQHAYVDLPAGKVAFQTGTVMASADEVHIKIIGHGGHGALPHELNDTVLAASNVIVALQQIVSRRRNPFSPMTLSFGKFIAPGATNVIPDEVVLAGSLRCMDESERFKMCKIIPDIIESTAAAYGCSCQVAIPQGYPCTVSHEDITAQVRAQAVNYLGAENVAEYPRRMTAEDFGFFTQKYPCCFYRFGVNNAQQTCGKLHSSTFLINEDALKTTSALFAFIALTSFPK
ncbi:MAG TPA: amidohydrolase [Porphyromonadaceae bacterium]|jgi:hippurate hydrolase|nr:amidohydrolase [Porphyromonadaceae bacterium]HBX20887.1 amidohydrolase [Porphyromonadaceae bacterium]HCM21045.1 amidohydrolase [Porphyromonadaceae bacterium]